MDPRPYTYEYRKPRFNNPTYHSQHLYDSIYHMPKYLDAKKFAPSERVDKIHNSPPKNYYGYQLPQNQRQFEQKKLINERVREPNYNEPQYQPERNGYPPERNGYPPRRQEQQQPQRQIRQPQTQRPAQYNNNNGGYRQVNRSNQMQPYKPQPYHAHQNPQNIQMRPPEEQNKSSRGAVRSYSQQSNKFSNKNSFSSYGQQLMRNFPGTDQDRVYERQEKAYNIINCYPREYPNIHRKYPKLTLQHQLIERDLLRPNPEFN